MNKTNFVDGSVLLETYIVKRDDNQFQGITIHSYGLCCIAKLKMGLGIERKMIVCTLAPMLNWLNVVGKVWFSTKTLCGS